MKNRQLLAVLNPSNPPTTTFAYTCHLLCQHVVFPLYRTRLQISAEVLGDAAGLQEAVAPARLATLLDTVGGDARAHALQARAGRVELLERVRCYTLCRQGRLT